MPDSFSIHFSRKRDHCKLVSNYAHTKKQEHEIKLCTKFKNEKKTKQKINTRKTLQSSLVEHTNTRSSQKCQFQIKFSYCVIYITI